MQIFNTYLLSVILTLGVATELLRSAHPLIMVFICAKLFQNKIQRFENYEANTKCTF
jgi:hypothetical protein